MNGVSEKPRPPRHVRTRRVPLPGRGQQVPDRLRPAAAAHHVRGQEARRRERRPDPVAAEPHPSGQGGHDGARLRQRGRRDSRPPSSPTTRRRSSPRPPTRTCCTRSRRELADLPGLHRGRRRTLSPRLLRPARRRRTSSTRCWHPLVERFASSCRRPSSETSAGSSPTTSGSTPSCRRCSPSPTPISRSSMSSPGTSAGCCVPTGRRCRSKCSRTSTWSPIGSSETGSGKIILERKPGVLDPVVTKGPHGMAPEELEALSRIIAELNDRFGVNLGPGAPRDPRADDGQARR